LAFFFSPIDARAWGCQCHQAIALLAEKHLNPRALAAVKQILQSNPVDPSLDRYCKEGNSDPLADASTWSDDIRGRRPQTAPWHFVDIPDGATFRDFRKYCPLPESCVWQVIQDQLAVLGRTAGSPATSTDQDADALRYLIHFVGDIHQPMHAISNNDLGGNCVPVNYFDQTPHLRNPQLQSYAPNLHGVWDVELISRMFAGKSAEQVAAELERESSSDKVKSKNAPLDIPGWAWSSHLQAVRVAYGKLPVRIPAEAPLPVKSCADANQVGERRLALHEQLAQPYQKAAAVVVRRPLALAGYRLAAILNALWP